MYHNLSKATSTINDCLVMRRFVGFEVELGLGLVGMLVRLAGVSVMVVVRVFDLVILVLAVVLQGESVALGVLGLGMDELQLVLVRADLDWVRQVLLVLFLHIDWHCVVVDELNRLVRLGVLVVDVVVVLRLCWLRVNVVLAGVLMNNASERDGNQCG